MRDEQMYFILTQNLRVYTVHEACNSTHVPSN